jgi:hypothetical protein
MIPRTILTVFSFALVPLSGCSSTGPASDEIARENAETNAVIAAAQNHPALKGNSAEASGEPLPPLPGVDVAVPAASNEEAEHQHPH